MTQLNHDDARRRLYWRLFWAAVMVAHVKATTGAIALLHAGNGTDAARTRLVLLSASLLFFLFEIVFAPCLRAMNKRRGAISLLLVVALLHAGVIRRCLSGVEHGPESNFVALVALGSSVAGHAIWRVPGRRRWPRIGSDIRPRRPLQSGSQQPMCLRIRACRSPLSGWLCAPLRAPPCPA